MYFVLRDFAVRTKKNHKLSAITAILKLNLQTRIHKGFDNFVYIPVPQMFHRENTLFNNCTPVTYPEVAADEDIDAGDDEEGENKLEHRGEYCVPRKTGINRALVCTCTYPGHQNIYQSLSIGVIVPAKPPLLQS